MDTAFASPLVSTGPSSDFIDNYALRRTEFRVRRLARLFRLDEDRADDLRQDMVVELLKALPRFDPSRCGRRTFVCRTLNRAYRHMARSLVTGLRHGAKNPKAMEDIDPVRNDPAKGGLSEQDLADLGIDFRQILPRMSPRLLRVAKAVMLHGNPAEAARALGLHRCNVLRAMRQIGSILVAAGYGNE